MPLLTSIPGRHSFGGGAADWAVSAGAGGAANTNNGVQQSVAIPAGNGTQVIYPRFTGTGAASGNWFTNTPANLVKF